MTAYRLGHSARKVSYEALGKKVGMSKMGVKYILDGKRHIADAKIAVFSNALGLDSTEKKYFKYLVQFTKAKTSADKDRYFRKMLEVRNAPIAESLLGDDGDLQFFSEWYLPVIAEMSYLDGFKEDAEWIRDRLNFKLSKQTIEEALSTLKRMRLLKGQVRGGVKIKLLDGIGSHIYNRFQRQVVAKSVEAIEFQPKEDREVFNLCVSIDKDRYQIAKEMIKDFRHKLHDVLANDAPCDRVVQINMQLFTTAKAGSQHE